MTVTGNEQGGAGTPRVDPSWLKALEWRNIGPFRGGRVVAVAADPVNKQVFYFGSTGGGVWKTTDGGVYWENVSDDYFKRASVGALAVAPSDPNVIYAGMGEATIRGNVSHGDGVWKSTDAGRSWKQVGLEQTRNIAKVRVHPTNPDVVYVAALGHAHGPNEERGVFRSRDGGATWERVLFVSQDVGVNELAMDPKNPRILYATTWRARRYPYKLESGGEGCGLWRSNDGGDTWEDLSRKEGLPKGTLGKIGVAVSPAKPGRVWAIVECDKSAVYRTDDGGEHWEKLSEQRELSERPWYYMHMMADPQDAETVWVLNVRLWRSNDGGKVFHHVPIPHGDNHDLWIDPEDPRRMIEGNDGGATVSFDGGVTWSSLYNQPTAEIYHVTTDTRTPYRVYGSQQDNSSLSLPSRSPHAAILKSEMHEVGGGESGYIAVRPDNPNIIFAGNYQGYLTRYDHATEQTRDITVWPDYMMGWPAKDVKYRFQWTFPTTLSPHDPNVLYVTGNHVFRSTDEGASWEPISPDLTRNDPATMQDSGGPLTRDNCGTEYYGTIFAFAESPRQAGVLWAGSDDGLVHVSRDGGRSWENVTPRALPEWALISIIEPSPHDPAVAYVAANRYKHDDFTPYFFKTADYGQSWTAITGGIPAGEFARAIREDPERRGLLYAGTEAGIHVSFDDGAHWQSLRTNLPAVPVHDLIVKDGDLVLATHGRGFWILDDINPLRQIADELRDTPAHLFAPSVTTRYARSMGFGSPTTAGYNYKSTSAFIATYKEKIKPNGEKQEHYLDAGQNAANGVVVTYYLREKPEGDITLTFLDEQGHEIRTFTSKKAEPKPTTATSADEGGEQTDEPRRDKEPAEQKEPTVPKEAGSNRFVWNMRRPDAPKIEGAAESEEPTPGPQVPAGRYRVRLSAGGETREQAFEIRLDPRLKVSREDQLAQAEMAQAIHEAIVKNNETINAIRDLRKQLDEWVRRAKGQQGEEALTKSAKAAKDKLAAIEQVLTEPKVQDRTDVLDHPIRLNTKLPWLAVTVASADAAPTRQAREAFALLKSQLDEQVAALQSVVEAEVAAFNAQVRDMGIQPVGVVAKQKA